MSSLLFFLVASIMFGSIFIGPFSIRVYATITMLFIFLIHNYYRKGSNRLPISKSYIYIFLLFVFFMGMSLLINGEFVEYGFIKKVLAYYLVGLVAFFSVDLFVDNKERIFIVVFLLSLIINLNNLVTILQYKGVSIGWSIGLIFSDITNDIDFAYLHDGEILGYSRTPGIFGSVVANAFNICVLTPLFFMRFEKQYKLYQKIYYMGTVLLSIFACFMTQQRTAFGLLIISMVVMLWAKIKRSIVFQLLFIILLVYLSFNTINALNEVDLGRLSSTSNDDRSVLISEAIDFIFNNFMWGGPMRFQKMAGLSSHNIILDSWIFAGFFGFFTMMVLYFKTVIKSFSGISIGFLRHSELIYPAMAVLLSMLYGLFHNTSFLTGNTMIFVLLALMLKMFELSKLHK